MKPRAHPEWNCGPDLAPSPESLVAARAESGGKPVRAGWRMVETIHVLYNALSYLVVSVG